MVKHTQRNIAFIVFGVIIIGSMVFLFLQGAEGGEVNVTLPPPNALLTSTDLIGFTPITQPIGAIPVGEIECKIKQTTQVFDAGNKIIDFEESSGIAGTPVITLQLTTVPSQFPINYFNIALKAFCVQQNNVPISVVAETIKVKALGTFLNERNVLLFEKAQSSSKVARFGSGQGEQVLTNVVMPKLFIEDGLPLADFPITIEFDVTGNIEVFYDNFPSFRYNIPLFQDNINSFITVNVERAVPSLDSDGDGVLDEFDLCPNEFGSVANMGCPAVVFCPDGSTVSDVNQCPIPPPPPDTCADTNDPFTCRIECVSQGGIYQQLEGVPVCILTPECAVGEKLELQTGNIFICVPDPDQLDSDGDGILNGIDACPNLFGVPEFNGCPSGTQTKTCPDGSVIPSSSQCPTPPVTGTLEEIILSGDVITLIEVVFTDNTNEVIIGSLKQGTGSTAQLTQSFGNIVPRQITGTIGAGQAKPIAEINYVIFFDLPNSQGVSLITSDISDLVFVIESSVSQANGRVVPLRGETIGESQRFALGTTTTVNGWVLGTSTVSASTISEIARLVIPPEQSRDADIIIVYDGSFSFNKGVESQTFVISSSEIIFNDFQISFEKIPVAPFNCEKQGQLPVKNEFGETIGCKAPDPNDPDILSCSSDFRVGFPCDTQFRVDNCSGTTTCIEPDADSDGIPDFLDGCIDRPEDGLTPNPTDGCPQDIPPDPLPPICPVGEICKPPIPPKPPVKPVCSETNPDACIFPPELFLTVVVIGAIIAIVIGVVVAIVRSRRRVFGG